MRPPSKGKTKHGRPPGRFTQHRRLDKLREALEANPSGLDIAGLAALLRVTTRSVRRYLRELDRQTDLESVATRPGGAHTWRIKPSERGRAVTLRRTQAYALLAARPLFEVLRGSALFDEIDVVMRKLLVLAQRPARAGVKGEVPGDQRLEERFLVVPRGARTYTTKGEELDDVFQAVAHSRVLRFRYRAALPATLVLAGTDGTPANPGRVERADRQLQEHVILPYALVLQEGSVVCVGHDRGCSAVLPFAVERMTETSVNDAETFVLPEEFDIAQYTHGEFGLGTGPRTRVLLEFEARVADEVRGRRLHPSQKVATASDGRMRLSMMVHDLDAVVAWVLSFGASARVIEPPELAQAVVNALRIALTRYGG